MTQTAFASDDVCCKVWVCKTQVQFFSFVCRRRGGGGATFGFSLDEEALSKSFQREDDNSDTQKQITSQTRTVRKSEYTLALALPKHMSGIFDEKCREKKNTGKNK